MTYELWILITFVIVAICLCFMLAVSNFAWERFYDRYEQFDTVSTSKELTPMEFVAKISAKYLRSPLQIVQIERIGGDAYAKGKLYLSFRTIESTGLASFTIIAHEMGHALQDQEGKKLYIMNLFRRIGRPVGMFMIPLYIAGFILLFFGGTLFYAGLGCIAGGLGIFLFALILKLCTISIEKDASKKAVRFLEQHLPPAEVKQCKRFLRDAKLTYWADLFRSLLGWTLLTKKSRLFK